ncbi:hypothetical protein [Methylobacter tundripaludum]
MTKRWTDAEKEALYLASLHYAEEINRYKALDPSSEIVQQIHSFLANSSRDAKSILYKLAEMGFLKTGKDTHQTGRFFVNCLKKSDFLNFKVAPNYKNLTTSQSSDFNSCYENETSKTCDVDELCIAMSRSLGLSSIRVKKELWGRKLIRLNPLMNYDLVLPLTPKEEDEYLKSKILSYEHQSQINTLRNDISYIYDTHSKDNPSITYSSDGTGTGKSYSVINSFIQQTDMNDIASGHRNLLFITPQKAQIDIDLKLIEIARNKGIKILSFLAQNDISNIDFRSWITKEVSVDVFNRWSKVLRNDKWLKEHIYQLDKAIGDAQFYNREIPKAKIRGEFEVVEEYEDRQKKNNDKIRKILLKLAEGILQQQRASGKYIPIAERFCAASFNKDGIPENKDGLLAEIIDFVLPFERAKLSPCILLATSDKFDYNVNIAVNNKDGKPVIKSLPFDYIIGQKKKPDPLAEDVRTADLNGRPFADQIDFLKTDYFLTDENNYFRKHNISFTLIVDEEHIAYDKFFKRSQKKLFDTNTQIAHVFAVVNRIVQSFESVTEADSDDFVLYEAHKNFVHELTSLFETKCEVSEGVTLNKILGIFSNNLNHIIIDSSELEQIIQICKNVFSITPKRFFNEQGLKKIRIGSYANNTECRIYFERDKSDTNPTMHDILQILMCIFGACSRFNDTDFRHMIRHGAENSQNALLDKFVQRAINARASVEAMFDRVDNENLYIDEFFTYYTPKVVFSIEKVNDLPFRSPQLKNKVYVTFRLDLFEALPEVTLMRVLHNTTNSIVCLSATSGFKNSYSGNYCRPVIEKFGSDTLGHLGYCTIHRTNTDAEKLQQLRESRGNARNVIIKEFESTEKNQITNAHNKSDFSDTYIFWLKSLRPHFKNANPYRIDEFKRQIEAMLLTAYEKKNSLILSLSNEFARVMRDFIKSEAGKRIKGLREIDEDKQKIFEIKPFDNGITLRVILFNADLVKELNIEEYLKLDDANTKIAFISSYKSAGTGLNLFTHYKNEEVDEDFERLVLINSPFYSNIFTPNGFNSIENYVLLLKHYADEAKSYQLKDFDVNLVNGNNYKVLMQEHSMSILKDIMQAVGRIERRDTYMNTEIFLPSDVIDDVALQFSRLKKEGNELIFQSMSLLNYKLMEHCLNRVCDHSFKSNEEREKFSANVAETGQAIDNLFKDYLNRKRLNNARQGDKSAVELNEALRSFDCIRDPQKYVDRLLALEEIKIDPFFQYVVSNFYLHREGNLRDITLCTKNSDNKTLTDLADGDKLYQPYNWILPKYHKSIRHQCSTSSKVLQPIFDLERSLSKDWSPHPAMLPMIKGNVGEYLFAKCLELINVSPLSVDTVFTRLDPMAYELFDFYVFLDNTVFCIDVKNWSASFDKEQLSSDTHEKALAKRKTLLQITNKKDHKAEFIYVNTHQDKNAINIKQEFGEGDAIHYMNLFKVMTQYENVNSYDPRRKSTLKDRLNINSSLIKLLGGSLNG